MFRLVLLLTLTVAATLIVANCCPGHRVRLTSCTDQDPYDLTERIVEDFRALDAASCALPSIDDRGCSAIPLGPIAINDAQNDDWTFLGFLRDMMVESDICADIVGDPIFADALTRAWKRHETIAAHLKTGELTERQAGARLLFAQVKPLNQCKSRMQPDKNIHGAFNPRTWTINIYESAVTAPSIYRQDITDLSVGFRYALIIGHELGHALDALTGDLTNAALCSTVEDRATIYGTYFAECISRVMRLGADRDGTSPEGIMCLSQRWKLYEFEYNRMRVELGRLRPSSKKKVTPAVAGVISCRGL